MAIGPEHIRGADLAAGARAFDSQGRADLMFDGIDHGLGVQTLGSRPARVGGSCHQSVSSPQMCPLTARSLGRGALDGGEEAVRDG